MSNGRVRRGFKTQDLLAERWRTNGVAPDAASNPRYLSGRDILNAPGLCVEVKAKDGLSLPAALKQARSYASDDETSIVVARHNGQGEAAMGQWTVTLSLEDFEALWTELRELRQVKVTAENTEGESPWL